MKGLKYTDNNEDYESDQDDRVERLVVVVELDEIWDDVLKRWKKYINDYGVEMLDQYDEYQWGNLLPDLIQNYSKKDDGWH